MTTPSSTIIAPDDSHNHASGDQDALFYSIAPCSSIVFEPAGYAIPLPEDLTNVRPNSIHLIHKNDEYFRASWDGVSAITLKKEVLPNIKGTNDFPGFVSGETYILGVGHDNYPTQNYIFQLSGSG